MKADWEEVLTFWFGELDEDGLAASDTLGRESTTEEREFLSGPGSSF